MHFIWFLKNIYIKTLGAFFEKYIFVILSILRKALKCDNFMSNFKDSTIKTFFVNLVDQYNCVYRRWQLSSLLKLYLRKKIVITSNT